MTYSCSDLADDVFAAALETGVVKEPAGDDEIEPSAQADLVMQALFTLKTQRDSTLASLKLVLADLEYLQECVANNAMAAYSNAHSVAVKAGARTVIAEAEGR